MVPATISWFAALNVCPEPGGPTRTAVVPIASKIGFTSSKSGRSALTMIDRVPSMAPVSPPLTGASMTRTTRRSTCLGQPRGDVEPDRGHVDVDRSFPGAAVNAALAQRQPFDIGRVRDHGDDRVRFLDGLGNAGGALAAGRHQALHRTSRAIEADDRVAGLHQMPRHRPTHDAEADERDRAHNRMTFSWRSQRRLSIVVVVGMYSSPTCPE